MEAGSVLRANNIVFGGIDKKTRKNGKRLDRSLMSSPKFANEENANTKSIVWTMASTTNGCRRTLRSAAMMYLARARVTSNKIVPSSEARPSWKLLASGRMGRKRTVTTAAGACLGDVRTEGTKLEPPMAVFE
jgi:hypothetical protein